MHAGHVLYTVLEAWTCLEIQGAAPGVLEERLTKELAIGHQGQAVPAVALTGCAAGQGATACWEGGGMIPFL